MKTKKSILLMALLCAINMWATMPTNISQYTSQGIVKVFSNDDNMDIPITYLAFENGTASWPMNCIRFYAPSNQSSGYILNASDLFDSSLSDNGQFTSYITQKDGYTFIDLQSKESGTWHLKLVQQNAGNWLYYYSTEPEKPVVSVATISQDCSKNGIQAALSATNGHEFVDLGLSVYWATCNVGATTPEGYGDYFAWGETSPKTTYVWSNYQYSNSTGSVMTKYNSTDGKTILDIEDDAAHVNWGGAWRMPTDEEFNELFSSCSKSNDYINYTSGYRLTGNGKSIFLPKAGTMVDGSLGNVGHVDIWTSSLCSNISQAILYGGDSGVKGRYDGSRCQGRSIRAVCPKNITPSGEEVTLTLLASGCSTPNTYTCSKGQQISIKAEAQANYEFTQWNDGSTENPRTITVNSNMTYMAMFSGKTYTITTTATNGSIFGGGPAEYGSEIKLTATPNAHYHFTKWSDGNTNNPRTITVVGDATYSVTFEIDEHTISATATNGSVTGGGVYNYGSKISLIATANYGYHFVRWSDGNTSNPRSITVTGNGSYQAICEANEYTISVSATNGSVSGGGKYLYNRQCVLTATPAEHYHFVQWSDGVKTNPRTITVTGNASYTAIFEINQYTLIVESENYNLGWVTSGGTYDALTKVLVMAAASASGYEWDRWSDGVTLAGRSITLMSDTTIIAHFTQKGASNCVEVDVNDASLGTADIQIMATPKNDASFTQWSDGNVDNPRLVTNIPGLYTAIFTSNSLTKVQEATTQSETSGARKIIMDNALIIINDGIQYNAQGMVIK